MSEIKSTTILGIVKDGVAALGGDGQVTFGNTVMKSSANKLRVMSKGRVVVGFAGAVADALALFDRFERYLKEYPEQLSRAAVSLAKEWRSDKVLRRLEAMLIAVDRTTALMISGSGDVIAPEDGIISIGSGAPYAISAARALVKYTDLNCEEIVRSSLEIAADICIYTNSSINVEVLK